MLIPFVERGFCGANGFGDGEFGVVCGGGDDGEAGSQRAVIEAGVEDRGAQPLCGGAVAMSFRDALDEAVQAQATQIVGDASWGVLARLVSEQRSKVLANIFVGKGALDEEEQEEDVEEALHARIGKAQRGGTLVVDDDGSLHILEGCFADEAVVTDALDVEQTSVGGKADVAQFGKIVDASADGEVASVVDGCLGSKSLSFLVVLLDAVLLVVDVQRGHDALCDDAGAELAGGAAGDLALEDQADLGGTADIEVLADDLLEEDTPGHRLIEHLGERELGLQDGELVAISGQETDAADV